jgi:hypothetical protein
MRKPDNYILIESMNNSCLDTPIKEKKKNTLLSFKDSFVDSDNFCNVDEHTSLDLKCIISSSNTLTAPSSYTY